MAGQQPLVGMFAYGAQRGLGVAAVNGFRNGMLQFSKDMPPALVSLGDALTKRGIPEGQVRKVNLRLAHGAHAAMMSSWRSRLPRNFTYSSPSRRSGSLGRALGDVEANTSKTTDRIIRFVDATHMGNEAIHWHRVNYGSGGAHDNGRHAQTFQGLINGKPFIELRDPTEHAKLHIIPNIIWGEGEHFFPGRPAKGGAKTRLGAGTRAAYFTDAGLEYLAKNIGPAYYLMFTDFIGDELNVQKLQAKQISVPADLRSPGNQVKFGYGGRINP